MIVSKIVLKFSRLPSNKKEETIGKIKTIDNEAPPNKIILEDCFIELLFKKILTIIDKTTIIDM